MEKIPLLILLLKVKMKARALKKKFKASKTSNLILNNTGQTKNFKQSPKLRKYLRKIRSWFLRMSGDPKKLALKI